MFSNHSYRFLKEISTSSAHQVSIFIKTFVLNSQINTDSAVYPRAAAAVTSMIFFLESFREFLLNILANIIPKANTIFSNII